MAGSLPVVLHNFSGIKLSDLIRLLGSRSFQYAPKVVKYVVALIFLINIRSWPLYWHWYIWKPVFQYRGRYYLHTLRHFLSPVHVRQQKKLEWLESFSPVGKNPFELTGIYRVWAGPDECDFNLHLSNSSYPKRLDAARFRFGLLLSPTFFRCGGWMGLGATHFTFLREIPIFSHYELRSTLMSWDNKWIFVATRYVIKPKKGKAKPRKAISSPQVPSADGVGPMPILRTANGVISGTDTPAGGNNPNLAAIAAQIIDRPEPDGATVHCLAISECVGKIGRITVPPALILAADGFARAPESLDGGVSPAPWSHANPPPHWETVRELRGQAHLEHTGSLKRLRAFYTGGWRDVPEDKRWWEDALQGEIEERRLRGLGCMQALRRGVEEARMI
uniref:Phosphate:H symporter (Phosphate:H symporter, variant) n=1 Tax=Ganoderma boninense TaxID=34458 RepID=A0A5K1K254_9APHY|nr:Phosphate:H symporter (Phosphate:H symporter, variant) [Ganoderma boninense]